MTGLCTGTPFDKPFQEGWAKVPHSRHDIYGRVGHHWTLAPPVKGFTQDPSAPVFKAACGITGATDPRFPALALGNWPACKRCTKAVGNAPTDTERRL